MENNWKHLVRIYTLHKSNWVNFECFCLFECKKWLFSASERYIWFLDNLGLLMFLPFIIIKVKKNKILKINTLASRFVDVSSLHHSFPPHKSRGVYSYTWEWNLGWKDNPITWVLNVILFHIHTFFHIQPWFVTEPF